MKRLALFSLSLIVLALPAAALERPFGDEPTLPSRTIEGTVEAVYLDDFDGGRSELAYHLVTDQGRRLPLAFPEGETQPYRTGDRLRVTGREGLSGRFQVDGAEALPALEKLSAEALTSWTLGAKKVLLIRFNFADDTSQPYSDATAQNTMFGASGSVAAFYKEGSYGLTTLSGAITPWLTVSKNKPTTCDISAYSEATTLAANAGYNSSNYDFTVWVFPSLPCGWAGLGVVGGSGAWINQALSTYVVSHELGHNFGLLHAHSLSCGGVSYGPSCSQSEYGDSFDTMGGGGHQFNAFSKAQMLQWLTGASVATRSAVGTATYALSPLEGNSGLRALQVQTATGRNYWVEFRQAMGFDASLSGNANVMNGAFIHIGPSADRGTNLLDMTPSTATFGDAALDAGGAFQDAAAGLTIRTVSKVGSILNVQVTLVPIPPTASFSWNPYGPSAGQTVTFTDTSVGAPTAWSWAFGDGMTSMLKNPTHVYSKAGTYNVTLKVSNAAGTSPVVTYPLTVSPPPPLVVTSLAANPAPPKPVGTLIAWTATTFGGLPPLTFQFRRLNVSTGVWTVVQPYSSSNKYSWTPLASQAGAYQIEVDARSSGTTSGFDASLVTPKFTITGPLSIQSLTPNPAPPLLFGTKITWTATTGGGTAPLQFKFRRFKQSTGTWTDVQAYSASNTFSWTPTASDTGSYEIAVQVKNAGSLAAFDAQLIGPLFAITAPPPVISALTPAPVPPWRVGTRITWTVTASGGQAPLTYSFRRLNVKTNVWTIVQPYATGNKYSWTPAATEAGTYKIEVRVRNAGSTATWDTHLIGPSFTINP